MYKTKEKLILASASPRRVDLLKEAGIDFEQVVADIDEKQLQGESAGELVQRLALGKATVVAKNNPKTWVLGADTTVVINNKILEKPKDVEHSKEMIKFLSGNIHSVLGGVSLVNLDKGISKVFLYETSVTFRKLSESEISAYANTKEGLDKAGSYAAQGIGASLIAGINGSYSNVVGLCMGGVVEELVRAGVIEV